MEGSSSMSFEVADSFFQFFDFILNGCESSTDSTLQQHCQRDDEPYTNLRYCKLLELAPSRGYAVLHRGNSEDEHVQDGERDEDHLCGLREKECER